MQHRLVLLFISCLIGLMPTQIAIAANAGDTIAEAPILWDLFYSDTDNTCDKNDDYDEVCPDSPSASGDAVYGLHYVGCGALFITVQTSEFVPKIYVYDVNQSVLACQEYDGGADNYHLDFGQPDDQLIYIVVDGDLDGCGEYTIMWDEMFGPPPYELEPEPGSMFEDEPELVDEYVDTYNGGCSSEPPVWQALTVPTGETEIDFFGTSGWYQRDGEDQRDEDWLQVVALGEEIIVTGDSEFYPTELGYYVDLDCDAMPLPIETQLRGGGLEWAMTIPTTAGQVIGLRVRPHEEALPDCVPETFDYKLHVTGVLGSTATEGIHWGEMKLQYR